ncbi:MAG: hypothetical protein N4A63_05190 [Vallitalea sp.]|nr:hypothetical protein [Vallitalea sp.]
MKKIRNLVLFFAMIMLLGGVNVYAASIGDKLEKPEENWKRYDDTISEISYINCDELYYYDKEHKSSFSGASTKARLIPEINFKFYGSKIRFIGISGPEVRRGYVKIIIDGVEHEFSQVGKINEYSYDVNILQFEKIGLVKEVHTVKITRDSSQTGKGMWIDAIDIDADGKMMTTDINTDIVNVVAPKQLKSLSDNEKITLEWNNVQEADSYVVFRSTTPDTGDYSIVANVKETTYIDNNVEQGTIYYYVVHAVKNSFMSKGSSVSTANIKRYLATIQIKLSTTDVYEYRITMNEVKDFIKWYTDRSNGTGLPFYKFKTVDLNIEPYTYSNEYLIFDKIVWFKIKEYTK